MEHHARIQEKTKIPDMLAQIAAIAGTGASGKPEVYAGAMGVNVALQLHFTRKLEAEADHHGTLYMAEAGFDPAGIARFFERIIAVQKGMPDSTPAYLYSHPEVEDRIGYVEAHAAQLEVAEGDRDALATRMQDAQARVAQLLAANRSSLNEGPKVAGNIIAPLMRAFEHMRSENRPKRALEMLRRAERLEPNDPRVYFQRGELLAELQRHDEAELAFAKTIELDPARALPYFRLAETLESLGHRERAVRLYERAEFRAGNNGQLQKRAAWAIMRLTFDEWAHCRNAALQETLSANTAPESDPANTAPEIATTAATLRPCPGSSS
jgi:predicted Zn-dependent protease